MNTKNKIVSLSIVFALIMVAVATFQAGVSFAANIKTPQPIEAKVVGMAKFVLQGKVTAVSADSLTVHITNTSKNAKVFDNKDKTLSLGKKTTLTKSGKNILLSQIKMGDKVKVFGVFDKKTGAITLVRWIKVVSK